MFVLDTNTLIYFFKGEGNVGERLLSKSPKEIAIPSIVLYELETGIRKSNYPSKRITQLKNLTSIIKILPFGIEEAQISAKIRAELEQKGTPIGPYDILIAGITLYNNGTLVTRNLKEFKRVDGLLAENWY